MKIEISYKTKKIQDVNVGDYVKSFDIEKNNIRHNRVSNTILPIVEKDRQTKIVCSDGYSLTTSNIHPMCYFNIENDKWEYKNTELIKVGDILKTENGQSIVSDIFVGLNEDEQFYDLTVDRDNNFFAGDSEDKMIVVHNSSTVHFQIWNKEIEEILVLKNNKGTDDNRVRRLDYSIQISKLFWERMLKGEDITLFSTYDVPGLYEAFGTDAFDDMYRKYENNKLIKGKKVKGKDLLITLASERMNTGRIYIQNIDNVNKQTPFKDHLTMSNLCLSGDTMVDVRILSKLEDELLFENLEELEEGLYCGKISLEELNSIYNTFVSELDSDNRIYVLSKDIESDIIEYNLVTNSALMNESSKVIKITSELNGENVTCTESHKIFTKNRGYVLACELKSDDTLDISGGNGGNLLIEKLNYEIPVYDITVDKVHNFYANDILVHNCQEINLPTSPLTDINDGLTYKKKIKVRKEDYEKFLELTKGDSIKIKKGLN